MTGGNTVYIRGLPFTSEASTEAYGQCVLEQITFSDMATPYIDNATDYVALRQTTTAGNDLNLTVAALNSTTADIQFQITYMID